MNFVAMVCGEQERNRVRNLLAALGVDTADLISLNDSSSPYVSVIAHNAKKTVSIDRQTFFRGSAIMRDRRDLIFGIDGMLSAGIESAADFASADGEFIAIDARCGLVSFVRDIFGHIRLLWSQLDDIVIVSDALLPMIELRRQLGVVTKINEEVLLARCVLNAVASQQLSDESVVEGIQFVPAGHNLSVCWDDERQRLSVRTHSTHLFESELGSSPQREYQTAIRQGATNVAALLEACARVEGWNSSLSLSGGYDSRVVLAAAELMNLHSSLRLDTILKSDEHRRDFDIASGLARTFGFAFNAAPETTFPVVSGDYYSDDPLTLWGASLAGLYDGMGPQTTRRAHANKFEFSGIGAELLKGNWGWQPWSELLASLGLKDGEVKRAFDRQGRRGLSVTNADPASTTASEHWYASYRNGIHGGAGHVSLHLTGLLPIQQQGLVSMAHAMAARAARRSRWRLQRRARRAAPDQTAIADMSILLSPRVALHPYDEPERDLRPEFVEARLRWLGGAIAPTDIEPFTIHGHPSRDSGGTSSWILRVSEARGFVGYGEPSASLLGASRERLESLPRGPVRDALREVHANAEWRTTVKGRPLWFAGASVAKVLSLALFD